MKKLLTVIAAIALVSIGGYSIYSLTNTPAPQPTTVVTESKPSLAVSDDGKTVSYTGVTGKTALEVLRSLTEVQTQTSQYGDFVTSINGVTANQSTEYWSFYVNGSYASEGAGTYQTKDGEKLEWRLEKM